MLDDSGDGERVSIQSRLVESFVNDLIEFSISSSGKEGIELNKRVLTLMRLLR